MHVSTKIFAAATMLGALSLSAQADTSSRGTLVRGSSLVFYGDLNIDSEQDAKILLQRIERAARKACGGHATFSSYTGSLDHTFAECQSEAVRRTVKSLGAPMVMRVYSEAEARDSRRSTLLKNHQTVRSGNMDYIKLESQLFAAPWTGTQFVFLSRPTD